mmetsp:Transcript_3205/g.8214  ORF Transcript_3205/g.8214 Transcript_3205/m.8214 type:complete len:141 (+) Transcript_3205:194-616(+)
MRAAQQQPLDFFFLEDESFFLDDFLDDFSFLDEVADFTALAASEVTAAADADVITGSTTAGAAGTSGAAGTTGAAVTASATACTGAGAVAAPVMRAISSWVKEPPCASLAKISGGQLKTEGCCTYCTGGAAYVTALGSAA